MSKIVYPKVALSTLADGNRYYDLGNPPQLTNMRAMTIWAWIWVDAVGFTFGRVFSCGDNTNELCIDGGVGLDEAKVFFEMVRSPSNARAHSAVDIPIGQWYFVSATWALDEIPIIYQGGIGEQIVEPATYTTQSAGSGTPADNSANNKWLLSRPTGTNNRNLDGAVASVGIINRVLSREELQTIKDRPRVVHGQLAYWIAGQDGTLNRITDYSKYGFHGSLNGTDALTSVRSVPIPHELPLKSRFALADPLPDTRVLGVPISGVPTMALPFDPLIGVAADGTASVVADFTITHGLSLAPGDVLIASVHWNQNGTITSNGGVFTEEFQEENPTVSTGQISYWSRIVDGSEGTTFRWDTTVSADVEIAIAQFRGIDLQNIWEVEPSAAQRSFGEPITELQVPDITTTVPSIGLIIVYGDHDTDIAPSYSNGYKQAIFSTIAQTTGIAYKVHDKSIKTGVHLSFDLSNDWIAHHIALKLKTKPSSVLSIPIEYEELTFDEDKEERLFMIPQPARKQS